MSVPDADGIVLAALSRFGDDRASLERFLDSSGLDVRGFRAALKDGSLTAGLLHHLALHDDLLVEVARDLGLAPEIVAAVASGTDHGAPPATPTIRVNAGSARPATALARRVRPKA